MGDPAPSLIVPSGDVFMGSIWVSGIFARYHTFCTEKEIGFIINAMSRGRGEILDMECENGLRDRVEKCMGLLGHKLGLGENVLIQCRHGILHSGSFLVLVLVVFIVLHDMLEGVNPPTPWEDAVDVAWSWWAMRRDLASRSDHLHDYEQESWTAMQDHFGELRESDAGGMAMILSRGLQRGAGSFWRAKAIVNCVYEMMSGQSQQSQLSDRSRSRSPNPVKLTPRPPSAPPPRMPRPPAECPPPECLAKRRAEAPPPRKPRPPAVPPPRELLLGAEAIPDDRPQVIGLRPPTVHHPKVRASQFSRYS